MTVHVPACLLKRGDVWEPEEQIDLESFNTNVFFELLLRQSLSITTKLGHFKEEVNWVWGPLIFIRKGLKHVVCYHCLLSFGCYFKFYLFRTGNTEKYRILKYVVYTM